MGLATDSSNPGRSASCLRAAASNSNLRATAANSIPGSAPRSAAGSSAGTEIAGGCHARPGTAAAATVEEPPRAPVWSRPASPSPPPTPEPESPSATPYDGIIEEASKLYGVSADLLRAVIATESNFDPRAKSSAGARGLMQLTPVTLRQIGMKIDPFDPQQNIFAGAKYLGLLLDRFDGNVSLALASYNAGPTAVRRHGGIPPYKETRGYVRKVQNLMADARAAAADETTAAD
jgi:soluble lytic murein transglycosylase-like protein